MLRTMIGTAAALLALGLLACQPATKDDVEAIQATQAEILKKLTDLETAQQKLAAAAPARKGPPTEDYNKVYKINLSKAPILGNPNAPITLVEYSDFQCPYCARTAPDVMAMLEKYPDKVRIVYKHFPLSFHPAARPAAIASVAAQEQGKFWEFHDIIFKKTSERQLKATEEDMIAYAKEAGLDVARFKQDMDTKSADFEKRVQADYVEGQSVDVRGTPTLYLNGKKVQNRSVGGLAATIDALLKEIDKG